MTRPKLEGIIYFEPMPDGTGDIRIVAYSRLPESDVGDLKMALFEPGYLLALFHNPSEMHKYRLYFDESGSPELRKTEIYQAKDRFEYRFRQISGFNGDPGIVLVLDGQGNAKIEAWMGGHNVIYPSHQFFRMFVTELHDPSLLLFQHQFSIQDVFGRKGAISGLPTGVPGKDYSIWATTPGPALPLWWSLKTDV